MTGGATVAVVALVGPTAAGKSRAGVELAQALSGEVVNADAMQLYRGMDIGTAKLPVGERGGVPHHLLDVWQVTEPASVARYQELARATVDRLLLTGRTVVVVGGSGLYVQALLDELEFPGTDPALRADLERALAEVGAPALHAQLAERDPAAATAILETNGRRIVRALEVIELTGRPFAATLPCPRSHYPAVLRVGIAPAPAVLDRRIDARVRRMFGAGLVEEVRGLEAVGLREGRTARMALGYRQVLEDPATAPERTAAATRRFARRQLAWFRRDQRIRWVADGQEIQEVLHAATEVVTRP